MKKSKTLIGLLLIFTCIISAQNSPQVTPTSPEASSLGRYGDLDLTSATGQMSFSVPLHTINVGENKWPVSLNYIYSGLILEGKPSLNGLGWNLNGYGTITKEVRGLPDGHRDGYYGSNNRESNINALVSDFQNQGQVSSMNTTYLDLEKFMKGTWDSEVDKYSLSINGQRIGFKLIRKYNQYGEAYASVYYLSKTQNFIIEPTLDPTETFSMASFTVTDSNGIVYKFDSDDREKVAPDPGGDNSYSDDATTAWMLSQIIFIDGRSISFEYDQDTYFSYDFTASATEKDLDDSSPGTSNLDIPAMDWAYVYNNTMHVKQMQRQILSEIIFPSGKIELDNIEINGMNGRNLYNQIVLKDNATPSNVITNYSFSYTGNRDLLKSITKNGEDYFSFDYYNEGNIPEFMDEPTDRPFDQDRWRYYNAAGNNRALHLPFDGTNYRSDKEPNFSTTQYGALKSIHFPTKGRTTIEYEANTIKKPYVPGSGSQNEPFNDEFIIKVDANTGNTDRHATITKTFTSPVRAYLYHKVKGTMRTGNSIYLSIDHTSGNTTSDYYPSCYYIDPTLSFLHYPTEFAYARSHMVEDSGPNNTCGDYYPNPIASPMLYIAYDPDNACHYSDDIHGCVSTEEVDLFDDSRGHFWIAPGTYTFSIDVNHMTWGGIMGEIGMKWYDPALDNGGVLPDYIDEAVGGIRVKKTIDYDLNGRVEQVKYLRYQDEDGFSSGRLNQIPTKSNTHQWNNIYADGSTGTVVDVQYLLNSYTTLNSSHGVPVYYDRIISFKNDNNVGNPNSYPQGYTISKYDLPIEEVEDYYPLVPLAEDLSKTKLKETYIKNSSDEVIQSTSISNQAYKWGYIAETNIDESIEHPFSFKVFLKPVNYLNFKDKCYEYSSSCYPALKELLDIKLYKEVELSNRIQSEVQNTRGVSVSKSFTYDPNYYIQKSVTTVDSYDDEYKEVFQYPFDDLNNGTSNSMVTRNQITEPLIVESFYNSTLISKKKTDFIKIGNDGFKPWKIWTAKISDDSLVYEQAMEFLYDNHGNIREVSKGLMTAPRTSYVWGYNKSLPIAKVENASYSEISTQISNLNLIGLSNSDFDNWEVSPSGNEESLRTALQNFRSAFPNAMITTYTYDPLIGVSSMTSPNNQTSYYAYDSQNRLIEVRDDDKNIVEKNEYYIIQD